MKTLRSSLAILIAAGLSANAQTAVTDPVGFVSYTVNANSDQKVGVPMQQASVFQGAATNVSGATVGVTSGPIASLNGANLLLVTSGAASGKWEEIVSATSNSVTLASSIQGLTNGNSFVIKPFWTLNSLFPNGGSIPKSSSLETPTAYVLVNDPTAVGINLATSKSYFYFDGTGNVPGFPAGWYVDGDLTPANNEILNPESFITIRNTTGSSFAVSFVGSVPVQGSALNVFSTSSGQQDNLIYNQFPSDVSLNDSGLVSSGAISPSSSLETPTDTLLVYSLNSNVGLNPASSVTYFYFDGTGNIPGFPAGWYVDGDLTPAGTEKLPAGCAYIIRKAGGVNQQTAFIPPVPYNLN